MKDCVQKHPNDHGQGYYHQSEKCKCIRRVCIYSLFISFTTFHFCTFIFVHSCYLTFLSLHEPGTGDGPLSQCLLVQKQPIRPIFDVIIIEKQASIKSLIPKHPEGVCPRGAVLPSPRTGEKSPRAACGRKSEGSFSAAVEKHEEKRKPEVFFGHRKVDRGTACGG